jgi:hypothetical protein
MENLVIHTEENIAPCGINCGTCRAYLRTKNHCPGCLVPSIEKAKTCIHCKIKNCEEHKNGSIRCSDCDLFPCRKMEHIDKRYRTRYKISLIQNLKEIKEKGITSFLSLEMERWKCSNCGSSLSVHSDRCLSCNQEYKKPYFGKTGN